MAYNSKPTPERTYVSKTRRCLKCHKPFESEWSGERVCKLCKRRHGWRDGTTSPPVYEVGRRR